jgi:hypothetical protein
MLAVPDQISTLELSKLYIRKVLERIEAENSPKPSESEESEES